MRGKASSVKKQRSKPYDRPQNNHFNAFQRRPFLGHGRLSTQTKANNQIKELSQDAIKELVRETIPSTRRINLDDLHKRVELFQAGQVRHHLP